METLKRLGAVSPGASNTALYVATSVSTLVGTIAVCEMAGAPATFRLAHVDGAIGSLVTADYFVYDAPLTANQFLGIQFAITMEDTHTLVCYASTANVNFIAWGTEITN